MRWEIFQAKHSMQTFDFGFRSFFSSSDAHRCTRGSQEYIFLSRGSALRLVSTDSRVQATRVYRRQHLLSRARRPEAVWIANWPRLRSLSPSGTRCAWPKFSPGVLPHLQSFLNLHLSPLAPCSRLGEIPRVSCVGFEFGGWLVDDKMKFQYSNLASLEVFRIRGMINRFSIILTLENSINTFIEFWQTGYYGCCISKL